MKVFIASAEKYAGKIHEDILIRDSFVSKGVASEIGTLSEITKTVQAGDTVMLKSIWGYHLDPEQFLGQIGFLEKRGVTLVNDYRFIRWNIDKQSYLSDLKFLNRIPTQAIDFSAARSPEEIRLQIEAATKDTGGSSFVVKPSISASGYLTFLYKKNDADENLFTSLFEHKDKGFVIQPFREEISDGEISVVVLNGIPLYAVRRFPGVLSPKQDPEYVDIQDISPSLLESIGPLMSFFESRFMSVPTICRADFIKYDSRHELMEVELIDPDLFLKYVPERVLGNSLLALTAHVTL